MRKTTKLLVALAMLLLAGQASASVTTEITKRYTSLDELKSGEVSFAIINEAAEGGAKALFGVHDQHLHYDATAIAFQPYNSAVTFKLEALTGDLEGKYLLQAVRPDGVNYNCWGWGGYLNSQPANGAVSFILGLNDQNGQDGPNLAVWEIEYSAEHSGFTLKNKGTDMYLNDATPAKYETPVYWTFAAINMQVPTPEAGNYYFKNEATGKYLTGGSNWGTHAFSNEIGIDINMDKKPSGKFTLETQIANSAEKHFLNGEFTDGLAYDWIVENVDGKEGVVYIFNGDQFLITGDDDVVSLKGRGELFTNQQLDADKYAKAQWKLVTKEERMAPMANATAENGVDVSFLIKGANFGRNDQRNSAWQRSNTGGNFNFAQTGLNNPNSDNGAGWAIVGCESWNSTFEMYQVIENLPAGVYEFSIAGFGTNNTTSIYAKGVNESVQPFANTSSNGYSFRTALEAIANGELTGNASGKVNVVKNLTIGVKRTTNTNKDWAVFDNARLTYYGPLGEDYYQTEFPTEVANATALLANQDYANVTGEERTNLTAAAAVTTPESYKDAYIALTDAITAFTEAKDAYNAYVALGQIKLEEIVPELPYADPAKRTAITEMEPQENPQTAAQATEYANTFNSELTQKIRAYYESNAMAEGVEGTVRNMTKLILNPNAEDDTNNWTKVGATVIRNNESMTDASGKNDYKYFDSNQWGDSSWDITLSQNITLPAGKYLLTVASRAAAELTTFDLFAKEVVAEGEEEPEANTFAMKHVGAADEVFDRGWNDATLEFTIEKGATVNIGVHGITETVHNWMSFTRFRLVQIEAMEPYATATDYDNLANAIAAAEEKTLGFDVDEYAPYTNAEALQAIETAKAIDPEDEMGNTLAEIQGLIDALGNWTVNTEEMQPIFNGMFAEVTPGANYPLGWTRTNAWGQMIADITGSYATAYYNQPGSMVYGKTTGYTLPLKANRRYTLVVYYRSHEENSNTKLTLQARLGDENIQTQEFEGNGSTSSWAKAEMTFKTKKDVQGDYILTITNTGNTWMTNVSLKLEEASDELTLELIEDLRAESEKARQMLLDYAKTTSKEQLMRLATAYAEALKLVKKADAEIKVEYNDVFNALQELKDAEADILNGPSTGIDAISAAQGKADIFNVNGQKVNTLRKGIYVINGKKVVK